jgi:hypothetical protein
LIRLNGQGKGSILVTLKVANGRWQCFLDWSSDLNDWPWVMRCNRSNAITPLVGEAYWPSVACAQRCHSRRDARVAHSSLAHCPRYRHSRWPYRPGYRRFPIHPYSDRLRYLRPPYSRLLTVQDGEYTGLELGRVVLLTIIIIRIRAGSQLLCRRMREKILMLDYELHQ